MTLNLKQLYRDFDHKQRATNVELYVERHRAPARSIFDALNLEPDTDKHFIFCGSIGSGKSSELAYLGHLLSESPERPDPGYLVFGLDVYQSIDDVATIRPAELLMLIGAAIVRAHKEWWQKPIPDEHEKALREAFFNAAPKSVDIGGILEGVALMTWGYKTLDLATAGAGVGKAFGAMGGLFKGKRRAPIGGLTRKSAREGDPDIAALLDAVNNLLAYVRKKDGRRPVILVDGLDKIDRLDGLATIRDLFCAPLLSNLSASCTYSVPITMMLETEWNSASSYFERERLTNLVIAAPSKGECDPQLIVQSRALLRAVVTKRLARHELAEQDLFDHGALDDLIGASGGVLRSMIHLVRQAIYTTIGRKGERVTLADTQQAIHDLGHEFEITMNVARREELRAIVENGEPSGSNTALELMLSNYVLHYRNGHSWWAPAPLVARIL